MSEPSIYSEVEFEYEQWLDEQYEAWVQREWEAMVSDFTD